METFSIPRWLTTERLSLQLFDHSDEHYDCLLFAVNSPTAIRNMGDIGIHTRDELDEMNRSARIRTSNSKGASVKLDMDLYYVLRLGGKTGPLLGGISAMQRSLQTPPDLGWCLLEEYQEKGFATEAATELLRYLRDDMLLTQLICWPGEKNIASRRVAEKLGFVRIQGSQQTGEKIGSVVVYVLPGMELDSKMKLSLWGESA